MSNQVRMSAVLLVLLPALLLVACGGAKAADPVTPPAVDGTMGVLNGAELVDTLCTTCHSRDRIDAASKDLVGWQTTIDRMISQNKAQITTEQRSAIALYLSR